jgi:hypothetical protein
MAPQHDQGMLLTCGGGVVCVLDLSYRLVFLGQDATTSERSRSRGLFRLMDWLAGGPGGGMAGWKHADESLSCFFIHVILS